MGVGPPPGCFTLSRCTPHLIGAFSQQAGLFILAAPRITFNSVCRLWRNCCILHAGQKSVYTHLHPLRTKSCTAALLRLARRGCAPRRGRREGGGVRDSASHPRRVEIWVWCGIFNLSLGRGLRESVRWSDVKRVWHIGKMERFA